MEMRRVSNRRLRAFTVILMLPFYLLLMLGLEIYERLFVRDDK